MCQVAPFAAPGCISLVVWFLRVSVKLGARGSITSTTNQNFYILAPRTGRRRSFPKVSPPLDFDKFSMGKVRNIIFYFDYNCIIWYRY